MNKTFVSLLLLALVCGIGLAASGLLVFSEGEERSPFTATTVTRIYDVAGTHVSTDKATYARRTDGSSSTLTSRTRTLGQGKQPVTLEKMHIVSTRERTRVSVDYAINSKTTVVLSRLPGGPVCGGELLGGPIEEERILGFEVVKTRRVVEDPEGISTVIEKWLAPELDCFPLKKVYARYPDNQPGQRSESEVVEIVLGEPSARFFTIPTDFTESTPSEAYLETMRLLGRDDSLCGADCQESRQRLLANADARYYAQQ